MIWCVRSIVVGILITFAGGFGLGTVFFKHPIFGVMTGGVSAILVILGFVAGIIGVCG